MLLDGPRLAPLSGSSPNALVVLIHGYGSNGDDMIALAGMMQQFLPNAAFVAPNAPGLIPHMAAAHQWWPIDTFSMAERSAGADAATPVLDAFITAELETAGLANSRLLLVGFSQGAMMALHMGLRLPEVAAGIVGISGMLVAPERLDAEIRSRPPVLLIHGTEDEVVPFRSMDLAATYLEQAGVPTETHISAGEEHGIAPDGLEAAIAFARRVLV